MGLIQKLKNKSVFLDTAPLIYYIEENPKYASVLNKKTPDAIQVATALFGSADYFLTNDVRLKAIKETEIVILDDFLKL